MVGTGAWPLGTGKLASAIWGWRIVFGRRRTGVSAKVALFEVNTSTGHQRVCGSTKLQFWSALTLLRWPGFTRFPCTLWQRQHPAAAAPLHCTCGTQGWPGIVTPAETDRWGLRGCRVAVSTMRSTKSKSRLEISELNELWTCYCYRFSIWFWIIFRITSDLAGPRTLVVTNPPWTSSLASQNVRHLRSPSPWPARLWSWSQFGTLGPQHSTRVQQNLFLSPSQSSPSCKYWSWKGGGPAQKLITRIFWTLFYTAVKEFPLLLQLEVEWQLFQYFAKLKLRCVLMHAHIQSWSLLCGMKPRLGRLVTWHPLDRGTC